MYFSTNKINKLTQDTGMYPPAPVVHSELREIFRGQNSEMLTVGGKAPKQLKLSRYNLVSMQIAMDSVYLKRKWSGNGKEANGRGRKLIGSLRFQLDFNPLNN